MNIDNNPVNAILAGLGLSDVEVATYQALLDNDLISIRRIAAATGINRGTTYEALKRLTALGLVSTRRHGNREHYVAESPDRILELIRDRRRDLLDIAAIAKEVVPSLAARKAQNEGQPLVRYYQDDDGIVTILKDILQTCRNLPKREYCAYSSSSIRSYLYRKFPQFTKQRIAEAIDVKVIAVGEGGEITERSQRKWIVNQDGAQTSSYTIVYGNKIATISIASNDTPYGVIIEDAGAAALQRLLFDQLWVKL